MELRRHIDGYCMDFFAGVWQKRLFTWAYSREGVIGIRELRVRSQGRYSAFMGVQSSRLPRTFSSRNCIQENILRVALLTGWHDQF
jgi:hypothetical protein